MLIKEGKSGVWKALGDQLRRRPDGFNAKTLTEADFSIAHQNYANPNVIFSFKKNYTLDIAFFIHN